MEFTKTAGEMHKNSESDGKLSILVGNLLVDPGFFAIKLVNLQLKGGFLGLITTKPKHISREISCKC